MTPRTTASAALTSILLLSGCAPTTTTPTTPITCPEILLAPNDPIQTVEAYMQAFENAREHLPTNLQQAYGKKRLALCAREIARLPSAPSKHLAAELSATLRREGIPVNAQPPTAGTPTIRYEELAKLQALTLCLTSPTPDDRLQEHPPKEHEKIPYLTWVHVMATVIHASPCFTMVSSFPNDVALPEMNTPAGVASAIDPLKPVFRESRLRLLNARPTLNVLAMLGEPSGWAYLLLDMANGADAGESPHQLEAVVDAVEKLANQGKGIDRSPATQKSLAHFLDELPNLRKFAAVLDANVLAANEARPDVEKFVAAVLAGNDDDLKTLAAPEAPQTARQWRESFNWQNNRKVILLRVGVADKPGSLMLSVLETDADGKVERETHFLNVRQLDAHWRITHD